MQASALNLGLNDHCASFVVQSPARASPTVEFSSEDHHCVQRSEDASRAPEHMEFTILAFLLEGIKRTALSCQNPSDNIKMEIGWPTDLQHVTHVTFDRFKGFLGLPAEFQMEIPRRVPSASANVFGVSPESMQCSYDRHGNSVPTILLLLQERLYGQGGLKAEGIFRINAENSQEQYVREQLNRGVVPLDIEVHCLAGLIKAWFRELPKGVLDSLSPEQVIQCETEDQCLTLIQTLLPTEAALLNWAVNLMADVVEEAPTNKMNAHSIAMVFAPNMTQMSDPLTALMHAVQVMNLLKTLILKTMKNREGLKSSASVSSSCNEPSAGSGCGSPACKVSDSSHTECEDAQIECDFFSVLNESESISARSSGETVVTDVSTIATNDEDELSSKVHPHNVDSTDEDGGCKGKHVCPSVSSIYRRDCILTDEPHCSNHELASACSVNMEKLMRDGEDFVIGEFCSV